MFASLRCFGAALLLCASAPAAFAQVAIWRTPGSPERGAALIQEKGCGACHEIPGVAGADGLVGPPLSHLARRVFIAGMLRNTPENLASWILDPQRVVPGNAMPSIGLSAEQAMDIAAYLETIR
jgi:cytochrome c2